MAGLRIRRQRDAPPHWDCLSEQQQLEIAAAALRQAIQIVAAQARLLANEMEQGTLGDRGGPDALRLLSDILEVSQPPPNGGTALHSSLLHLRAAGHA